MTKRTSRPLKGHDNRLRPESRLDNAEIALKECAAHWLSPGEKSHLRVIEEQIAIARSRLMDAVGPPSIRDEQDLLGLIDGIESKIKRLQISLLPFVVKEL